jgi:hypothetical protein
MTQWSEDIATKRYTEMIIDVKEFSEITHLMNEGKHILIISLQVMYQHIENTEVKVYSLL